MNIIRELRKRANLQQKDLASAVGVSVATVSDWETQKKDPSNERLQKLAKLFGVDPLVVLGCGIIDLSHFGVEPKQVQPAQTPEARIVSFGMDQLPKEEREKILTILQTMYNNNPKLFRRETENDDA